MLPTFSEVIDVDGRLVTLEIVGDVVASSSFQVALSPLPADFDGDGDVDADDLVRWEVDFGGPGADSNEDGDSDGADFIAWQRQFGLGVTPLAAAQAVPEPGVLALLSAAIVSAGARRLTDPKTL